MCASRLKEIISASAASSRTKFVVTSGRGKRRRMRNVRITLRVTASLQEVWQWMMEREPIKLITRWFNFL